MRVQKPDQASPCGSPRNQVERKMNDIGEPRVKRLPAWPGSSLRHAFEDPAGGPGIRVSPAREARAAARYRVTLLLTTGRFVGGKDSVRLFLKPFERASH